MEVQNNISAIQVNFDGINTSFYLFDNTKFFNKRISEIRIMCAPAGQTIKSPFDGFQLLDESMLSNIYVDLVRDDKTVIAQGMNAQMINILANRRVEINSILNFTMSSLNYWDSATLAQTAGKCVLVYVHYDETETDDSMIQEQGVSVDIDTTDDIVCLEDYITDYIGQQGDRVMAIDAETVAGAWFLSLRDKSGRAFEYMPWNRLQQNTGALPIQHQLMLDGYDVDFRNSYIYNATGGKMSLKLNLYY